MESISSIIHIIKDKLNSEDHRIEFNKFSFLGNYLANLLGSACFLTGSVLYNNSATLSNIGGPIYVIGSVCFLIASIANFHITSFYASKDKNMFCISVFYVYGDCCYLIGSIFFLSLHKMYEDVGHILFVVGSILFLYALLLGLLQAQKMFLTQKITKNTAIIECFLTLIHFIGAVAYLCGSAVYCTDHNTHTARICNIIGAIFLLIRSCCECSTQLWRYARMMKKAQSNNSKNVVGKVGHDTVEARGNRTINGIEVALVEPFVEIVSEERQSLSTLKPDLARVFPLPENGSIETNS